MSQRHRLVIKGFTMIPRGCDIKIKIQCHTMSHDVTDLVFIKVIFSNRKCPKSS